MNTSSSRNLSRIWNWGRLVIGVLGLLLVVYAVAEEDALLNTFTQVNLLLAFFAFSLHIFATLLKTLRWWLVLRESQIYIGFQRLFGTYMVGIFFGQFMPGASMSGDAVRMVETSVDTGRTVTSVSSVLIERAIGMVTIVASASFIMIVAPQQELTGTLAYWVLHVLSVLGIGALVILRMGWFIEPIVRLLGIIRLQTIGDKIMTLSQALQGHLGKSRLLLNMALLSAASNLLIMTSSYIVLLSLGEVTPYVSFIPLIALAAAVETIPLSPGALGLREATYVTFLSTYLDVSPAAALSTALIVRVMAWGLAVMGGIIFMARAAESNKRRPAQATAPTAPSQHEKVGV